MGILIRCWKIHRTSPWEPETIFVIYISSGIISGIAFSVFASVTNLQNAYLLGASASIMGIVGIILSVYLRKWVKKQKSPLSANRELGKIVFSYLESICFLI